MAITARGGWPEPQFTFLASPVRNTSGGAVCAWHKRTAGEPQGSEEYALRHDSEGHTPALRLRHFRGEAMSTEERGNLALTLVGTALLITGGTMIWGWSGGILMAGASFLVMAGARL